MTNLQITNILEKIIHLNPFDAVVILHQYEERFFVEKVNEKATILFKTRVEQGMDAASYFGSNWTILMPYVLQHEHHIFKIAFHDHIEFAACVQLFTENTERYVILVFRALLTNEERNQARYNFNIYYDELTELYNRRALTEHWSKIHSQAEQLNTALMLVDLDRFKKFNESLGKMKADSLLLNVSRRLKTLRSDFCEVFHYSGDEYVIIFHYNEQTELDACIENIFRMFKKPFTIDEQEYFITISIGITIDTGEQRNLEIIMNEADQALFFVKNNGRSTYRFYEKDLIQYFPNEALMEAHLHRAIELDEMTVHFQPQIDLKTNTINSFEALIRWHNRKFGMVSPGQFIPLAESSGLILPIGDWVLERVCQYQKEWREQGFRPVRIAVNISPKQFKQKNFATRIEQLLIQYEIEPKYLELEITESSMTNLHETTSILLRLKKLGVFVSVDDFGTGYSSLSYLKKYPIDIIKIDQSFIADIQKDKKNEAIVEAIILLSHTLGLEVVAEGVEEMAQEQFLRKFNCQKVQGYLYDRPLPANKVVEQYFLN